MKKKKKKVLESIMKEAGGLGILVVLLIGALAYSWYEYSILSDENIILTGRVAEIEQRLRNTEEELTDSEEENDRLSDELGEEQDKVSSIEDAVDEVTDIVGDLQKLEAIEPELLQKYSKVYFLNEHYTPKKLRDIKSKYLYDESKTIEIDSRVWKFLDDLLDDAEDDGIDLFVASGYRSFGVQAGLKESYTVTYGSGANAFSADQGYSEHQLGTTVDFLTTGINGSLSEFGGTEAHEWLLDNAHKYGFVLSYPEGNSYYISEPWHWRFVGKDLARDLNKKALFFYDMPQKVIDTYRLELFD